MSRNRLSTQAGSNPSRSARGIKRERGPAPLQVSVHATVIWPSTGVKVQLEPFATIDRARLMSTVSLVDPDLREGHPDMSPGTGIVLDRDVEAALVNVDVGSHAGDRDGGGQRECEECTSHTHPPRRHVGRGGR